MQPLTQLMSQVESNVVPILEGEARRVDLEGLWPAASVKTLKESGLLGLTIPAEFGGSGAGMREFAAITERLARACASTAMIYLMHVCGTQAIAMSGSLKREGALKKIAAAEALATLAFSERGSRSHFWAPVSRAQRNASVVVLNCEKSFVTSAGYADYYVTSAGAVDGKTPADSTLYLVERGLERHRVAGELKRSHDPARLSCRTGLQALTRGTGFQNDDGSSPALVPDRERCCFARHWRGCLRLSRTAHQQRSPGAPGGKPCERNPRHPRQARAHAPGFGCGARFSRSDPGENRIRQ